jgi:glutamyl-tRNA reductase
MDVLFLGTSHRLAGLDVRARLARPVADAEAWLATASARVPSAQELLLLATCHRVECYAMTADPAATAQGLREALGAEGDLAPALVVRTGADAATHLARVACGLDSVIIGEAEIAGQIRRAAETARRAGTLGPCLERVLAGALRASGRARAETGIARGVTSAASAAVALASGLCGPLDTRTVLVAGAGQAGRQALARLARLRPGRLLVASRSARHATEAAEATGASVILLSDVATSLSEIDLIVAAMHAPLALGDSGQVIDRTARPLVAIDLSVPRALDPALASWPGVTLRTLDDLGDLARRTTARRLAEVPRAEAIAREEAARAFGHLAARHGRVRH